MKEETIAEYIERKGKHLHSWWGDSESNAPDWDLDAISGFTVVCEVCGGRFPSPDSLNEHWKSEHAICYGTGSHYFMIHHPNGFSEENEKTIQRWLKANHLPIEKSELS